MKYASRRTMKKAFYVMITGALILSISACGTVSNLDDTTSGDFPANVDSASQMSEMANNESASLSKETSDETLPYMDLPASYFEETEERGTDAFTYTENDFRGGNLIFYVVDSNRHDYPETYEYICNGLLRFFKEPFSKSSKQY